MADTVARKLTADEFLAWDLTQPDQRHEFVDGAPVAMAGATDRHDQIVINLIVGLAPRLRGGPCAPRTADQAVKTKADQRVRRPDVIVDCGPRPPKGLFTPNPTVVFEVLSPSTEKENLGVKLDEYKAVASMRHVVLLDQERVAVTCYSRDAEDVWMKEEIADMSRALKLAALGVDVPLAEIYADVEFEDGED
jgi:Uma2 family endonuclease